MERLTFEGNFCDLAQCRDTACKQSGTCTMKEVWKRLKAYEDSGCEPEEVLTKDKADEIALKLMRLADLESLCSYDHLRELAEADKDGRVLILPHKDYTWSLRGDIAIGIVKANCRQAAKAEKAMKGETGK